MQDLIQRLRQIHSTFNLPCNEAQLRYLKVILQAQDWPDHNAPENPVLGDLTALYRDHNGMPISYDRAPFPRMMSFEEALAFNNAVSHWIEDDQYLFWTDDESNYFGVYLHEPLMGRVFYLNHEEPDSAPRFRSVRRTYEALLTYAERRLKGIYDGDWAWWHWEYAGRQMNTDYPKTAPDPEHDDEDMEAAQVYIERYHQEDGIDKRRTYAYLVMNLIPFNVREPLEVFIGDERDFFVQARAIDIFALRRDEAAIPKIERLIRTSRTNPRTHGLLALARIGTPGAVDALIGIARDIEKIDALGHAYIVLDAFKRLGYETMREGNKFSYRKSGADKWTYFGDV